MIFKPKVLATAIVLICLLVSASALLFVQSPSLALAQMNPATCSCAQKSVTDNGNNEKIYLQHCVCGQIQCVFAAESRTPSTEYHGPQCFK